MKWVVIATAPEQVMAEVWSNLLRGAGVEAQVRAGDTSTFLGVSYFPCRVMVPQGREAEAIAVLSAHLMPADMENVGAEGEQ